MFASTLTLASRVPLMLVVGVAAGIANGVAGGGTFISFPALLTLGVAPLAANVSTSVGVCPSYVGGMWRFRSQITPHRRLLMALLPSCALGAALGCALLLVFPATAFRSVVPWLIGAGTLLFALSPFISRRLAHIDHSHPGRRWFLFVGVFLIAVYGGYFGAGLGILLLAVMAVALPFELTELQGLRSVLSTIINLFAATIFVIRGHLVLWAVFTLLAGTLAGGWMGTWLVQRLSPRAVRGLIVGIGVVTTVHLA
jgi:uncharacterized membrane protein YfcA